MKFSKKIIAQDRDTVCTIDLKVTTDGHLLTADESRREFNKVLNDIHSALSKLYNVSQIKVK